MRWNIKQMFFSGPMDQRDRNFLANCPQDQIDIEHLRMKLEHDK